MLFSSSFCYLLTRAGESHFLNIAVRFPNLRFVLNFLSQTDTLNIAKSRNYLRRHGLEIMVTK